MLNKACWFTQWGVKKNKTLALENERSKITFCGSLGT